MDWKKIAQKPWTAIAGLSAFTGLLVDFQGAASKMSEAIPILSAFLPTFAIAGTAGLSSWIVYSGFRWIWNILPSQRFSHCGQIYHCLSLLTDAVGPYPSNERYIYSQIQRLIPILIKFGIKCPDTKNIACEEKYNSVWFNFLVQLTACGSDLKMARLLSKQLRSGK